MTLPAPGIRTLQRGHVINPQQSLAEACLCDASTVAARQRVDAAESPKVECIDSRSKAGCLSRNSAVDDSIGESYGVTDFSVQ